MDKFIFRKMLNQDAEEFVDLRNLVWRDAYKDIFPNELFDEREKERNEKIESFKTWPLNQEENVDYVVEKDGKVIGFMIAQGVSRCEYFANLGYACIGALYIHPDYQHRGLGKKLFDIFVSEMKKLGKKKFEIGVLKKNHKARKAYEKWGGVLSEYTHYYSKMGFQTEEVFYIFDIENL